MNINVFGSNTDEENGDRELGRKRELIYTTLKLSSLDCASIPGYLSAADGRKGNVIPSQSEI